MTRQQPVALSRLGGQEKKNACHRRTLASRPFVRFCSDSLLYGNCQRVYYELNLALRDSVRWSDENMVSDHAVDLYVSVP